MQRLVQRSPPAVAHAELVLVAVTRIVVMGHGNRQAIAVHRSICMGENQIAVDKADAASPCQSRRLMVVSQTAFQTRKARDIKLLPRILIFHHAAVVLIHTADIWLVVIGDGLRIPVLQHFLAHDGSIRCRCVDIANAQLCGRDEMIRAQTKHGIAMRRKMALSMI